MELTDFPDNCPVTIHLLKERYEIETNLINTNIYFLPSYSVLMFYAMKMGYFLGNSTE